jgi:hypothetical protein
MVIVFFFQRKKSVKDVGRGPSLHTEVKAGPVPGYSGQEGSLTISAVIIGPLMLISIKNCEFPCLKHF